MRSSDFGLITSPAMIGKSKPKPTTKPSSKPVKSGGKKSGKGR